MAEKIKVIDEELIHRNLEDGREKPREEVLGHPGEGQRRPKGWSPRRLPFCFKRKIRTSSGRFIRPPGK